MSRRRMGIGRRFTLWWMLNFMPADVAAVVKAARQWVAAEEDESAQCALRLHMAVEALEKNYGPERP